MVRRMPVPSVKFDGPLLSVESHAARDHDTSIACDSTAFPDRPCDLSSSPIPYSICSLETGMQIIIVHDPASLDQPAQVMFIDALLKLWSSNNQLVSLHFVHPVPLAWQFNGVAT